MVEPIKTGEVFGKATATLGDRPKHVDDDHLTCAFYDASADSDDRATELYCPHGTMAFGAFYNEDFLWQLRTTSHNLITRLLTMNLTKDQFRQIRNDLHQLELLTK